MVDKDGKDKKNKDPSSETESLAAQLATKKKVLKKQSTVVTSKKDDTNSLANALADNSVLARAQRRREEEEKEKKKKDEDKEQDDNDNEWGDEPAPEVKEPPDPKFDQVSTPEVNDPTDSKIEQIKMDIENKVQEMIELENNQNDLVQAYNKHNEILDSKKDLYSEIWKIIEEFGNEEEKENLAILGNEISALDQKLNTDVNKLNHNYERYEKIEAQYDELTDAYAAMTSPKDKDKLEETLAKKYEFHESHATFDEYKPILFTDLKAIAENALKRPVVAQPDKNNEVTLIEEKIRKNIQDFLGLEKDHKILMNNARTENKKLNEKVRLFYEFSKAIHENIKENNPNALKNKENLASELIKLGNEINDLHKTLNQSIKKLNLSTNMFNFLTEESDELSEIHSKLTSDNETDTFKKKLVSEIKPNKINFKDFMQYDQDPAPDLNALAENASRGIMEMPAGITQYTAFTKKAFDKIFVPVIDSSFSAENDINAKEIPEIPKIPEKVPEKEPEKKPEEIPKELPEKVPEEIPEKIPERAPEEMPEKAPEVQKVPPPVPSREGRGALSKVQEEPKVPPPVPSRKGRGALSKVQEDPKVPPPKPLSKLPSKPPSNMPPKLPSKPPSILPILSSKPPPNVPPKLPSKPPSTLPPILSSKPPPNVSSTKRASVITPALKELMRSKGNESSNQLNAITNTHGTLNDLKKYLDNPDYRKACFVVKTEPYSNQDQNGLKIEMKGKKHNNYVYAFETEGKELCYAVKKTLPDEDKERTIANVCKMAINSAKPGAIFDLKNTPENKRDLVYEKLNLAIKQAERDHRFEKDKLPIITGYDVRKKPSSRKGG